MRFEALGVRQRRQRTAGLWLCLLVLSTTVSVHSAPRPAAADDTASSAARDFMRVWMRTDRPVLEQQVQRTWVWGQLNGGPMQEEYAEAPGGTRLVQYTDKSRMELTDPSAPVGIYDTWRVTNGLLVQELMSGRLQVGHEAFEMREPADVIVAGDPTGPGPTYRQFAGLIGEPMPAAGTPVTALIESSGAIRTDDSLAALGVTAALPVPETRHAVANVFVEFLTSSGPAYHAELGYFDGPLFEHLFYPAGLPLTEAYWTTVSVLGAPTLVLVQAFERRVLTYTPTNPDGWKVEAGNVGAHYYRWRYGREPMPKLPTMPVIGPEGLSFVLGVSVQGRPIEAVRLGDGPLTVVCISGIHTGEESNTVTLLNELLAYLRDHPDAIDPYLTLIFVPALNPDGLALETRTNANGVDLNRNWPANWQPTAVHGEEVVSAGSAPLSEPEVAAMYRALVTIRPEAVLSWHAAFPPDGAVEGNDLPEGDSLAEVFSSRAGGVYLWEWELYPITGQLLDTLRNLGIPAADVELADYTGTSFDTNWDGLRGVMEHLVEQQAMR
jgi:hypothetical protein